ncbi:DUF4190 domain-containing protein [Mycobacterium camsae]|uniref:DUF4190 domain-containing protein n=1 Tax=Mycobacterium gordonae TaxID=1778 RepID=UPI001F11E7A3|nr:DUF4190 domain-containing protein [Mycobacterium gordonae]
MTEQPPNFPPPNYPPPSPGGYGYPPPNHPASPGGYGYPPMYSTPRTNALAIASLVAAIAGIFTCGIGNILGLIFGVVGLGQIKRTGEGGRGLAIAGIVISGLTFAFLLAAIIFGSIHRHDHEEDNYSSQGTSISAQA